MTKYDYIIVGGGASGLMMAYRMSQDSFFDDKSILILDREKKNTNDRTWCYWEDEADDWNSIVSKTWDAIIFKSELYSTEEIIAPYQYKMIRSADFYKKIWNHLEAKSNIAFIATKVIQVKQLDAIAEVITNDETFHLINNAGLSINGPLELLDHSEIKKVIDVNSCV